MKCIINGRIILPNQILDGMAVLFDKTIIDIIEQDEVKNYVELEIIDAAGKFVSPGLIDVHIHGFQGDDSSDGDLEGIRRISKALLENGVTGWLPTTITIEKSLIVKALETIREGKKLSTEGKEAWQGAQVLGCHVEGPFINPNKKGAQPEEYILKPDAKFVKEFADVISIISMAPEMDENFEFIKEVTRDTDVVVSMGHTDATYETAVAAVEAGVSHVTHLFNAMSALNHRKPGVVAAALNTDVATELIVDTFHIHPGLFSLIDKIKGDKLCLITDCLRAGGLADGEYTLGGQKFVLKGIECRLEDGTIAGSVLRLNQGVKNVMKYTDMPMWQVVAAASLNPAKSIGLAATKGSLENGKDADIIITDEDYNVEQTFIRGELYYNTISHKKQ